MNFRWYSLFIMVLFISNLVSCNNPAHHSTKHTEHTYLVKPEPIYKTLFFTGTIQPLRETAITSPMDAVIETMNHHYGQIINKDDIVVTLDSAELQKQYNDTLTDYLKAKDSFSIANAKFIGTQNLWDAGLLSKNNFLSEKSSLDTARVTLMQTTKKLMDMLRKMDTMNKRKETVLSNLNIAEFEKVKQALTGKYNIIHLRAPTNGILLYPPKIADDKTGHLTVGSTVKAGQVFGLIGDLSGISVEIDVPEVDIDKIRPGMPATITGVALGKEKLHGELVVVNAQASASNSGALPSFSAIIEVKTLTQEERALIKVGMSAVIELTIEEPSQLKIPILAVKQNRGTSVVKIRNKDGSISIQQVSTKTAEADKVVIDSGLKEGDVVVYDDQSSY